MDYQYLRYLTILQTYGTPLLALIARFPGPLHGLSIWFMWKTADLSVAQDTIADVLHKEAEDTKGH